MQSVLLVERNIINLEQINQGIDQLLHQHRASDPRIKNWANTVFRKYLINAYPDVIQLNTSNIDNLPDSNSKKSAVELIQNSPLFKEKLQSGQDLYYVPFPQGRGDLRNEFEHVLDWLVSIDKNDPRLNRLSRMSYADAVKKSQLWIEKLTKNAFTTDQPGQPILKLDNGMTWVKLQTIDCLSQEGSQMQHCVGDPSYATAVQHNQVEIYSLRDKNNYSHVTLEILIDHHPDEPASYKSLAQIKGKANKLPKKYIEPIVKIINKLRLDNLSDSNDLKDLLERSKLVILRNQIVHINQTSELDEIHDHIEFYKKQDGSILIVSAYDKDELIAKIVFLKNIHTGFLSSNKIIQSHFDTPRQKNAVLAYISRKTQIIEYIIKESNSINENWGWSTIEELITNINLYAEKIKKAEKILRIKSPKYIDNPNLDQVYNHLIYYERLGPNLHFRNLLQETKKKYAAVLRNLEQYYESLEAQIAKSAIFIKENQESTPKKYRDRTEWLNSQGQKHRLDGPAVEYRDGSKEWYQNGQRHRTDGPAVEWANGNKLWYQNNLRHRLDGPAVELADGTKEWWQNDQRHRLDGPAVEYANGHKEWWQNGKRHRTDGPAVEWADGTKEWWQNDQLHRIDGPAVELANGDKQWWQNDQLHRIDGPAREYPDGRKSWWQNGQRHRIDGPAIERTDGSKEWWLFGKRYPNEKSWEQARNKLFLIIKPPVVKENQESTPKKYRDRTEWRTSQGQLHRLDGPAVEHPDGHKEWWQNGKRHRIDGPAVEWANGNKLWYQNNLRHRLDGPAVELADGTKEWYLFDKKYPNEKSWEQARNKLFLIYKPPIGKN